MRKADTTWTTHTASLVVTNIECPFCRRLETDTANERDAETNEDAQCHYQP